MFEKLEQICIFAIFGIRLTGCWLLGDIIYFLYDIKVVVVFECSFVPLKKYLCHNVVEVIEANFNKVQNK